MTLISSRRPLGEPAPELARGLGKVLVASAQLAAVAGEVDAASGVQPELERLDATRDRWREVAAGMLELRERIEAAAASMIFTGSSGEHLTIKGRDGVLIPADAAYLSTLARRMDRHARAGRVFAAVDAETVA
ncbi:MAG TPA: hypothetical protein VNR36_11390 [Pseudolysinimonas sp.]|nr:hypothetical protein [Pseudolysinimonas sp.]